jgi:putative restriction endonuclease
LIYFHAVAESIYKAIYPCFIESVDLQNMNCRISVSSDLISGNNIFYARDSEAWKIERRYALRETKARLHQADFRIQVLNTYGKRCSMTGLPVPQLLEAAHIVPDSHELGEASIQNGICLSRIHHRAFDSNLIGITPDYKILVSQKLLEINDGPILESGIKLLHGQKLKLPRIRKNWPSQDLLSQRFEFFKKWSFVK